MKPLIQHFMRKIGMTLIGVVLVPMAYSFADSGVTSRFMLIRNNRVIGEAVTQRTKCEKGYRMSLAYAVKERLLLEFNISVNAENIMGPEYLLTSTYEKKINGSIKNRSSLILQNNRYILDSKGGFAGPIPPRIPFTVTMLYFFEPYEQREIYSENHKKMILIEKLEPGKYRLNTPDGNYSDYFYRNSTLDKVIVHTGYGDITFSRY